MFVNVRVVTSVQDDGLTIPLEAVQQGPRGQYVFVVGPDHKLSMQPVSASETLNGVALIDKGLSTGETVVTRGQYRLTPGTVVSLANRIIRLPCRTPQRRARGFCHKHLGNVHPQADRHRDADGGNPAAWTDRLRAVAVAICCWSCKLGVRYPALQAPDSKWCAFQNLPGLTNFNWERPIGERQIRQCAC
jgi:hypothetical protein